MHSVIVACRARTDCHQSCGVCGDTKRNHYIVVLVFAYWILDRIQQLGVKGGKKMASFAFPKEPVRAWACPACGRIVNRPLYKTASGMSDRVLSSCVCGQEIAWY